MVTLVALAVWVAVSLTAAEVIDNRTTLHPPTWKFFWAWMACGLSSYYLTLGIFAWIGIS